MVGVNGRGINHALAGGRRPGYEVTSQYDTCIIYNHDCIEGIRHVKNCL